MYWGHTSPVLDQPVDPLAGLHGVQVEQLDNGPGLGQLWRVIGRRGELLDILPPHAGGGLLAPHDGAVAKVTLDKKDHLLITHKHIIGADVVQPALHQGLDSCLIFFSANTGSSKRGRYGGH